MMPEGLVLRGLQYAGYALEFGLLAFLLSRGFSQRPRWLCAYVAAFCSVDAVLRPWILYRYGASSREYYNVYWLSDALLVLATFLLLCAFFRRACSHAPELWAFLRPVLGLILLLVLGISAFTLSQHRNDLFTAYIFSFEQNLYFTCLVLNTALYVMLQWLGSSDRQLELLVCGLGVQYAGCAASFALVYLTHNLSDATRQASVYLSSVCDLARLAIWLFAVASVPRVGTPPLTGGTAEVPVPV